jgi:hypothetical protein
MTETRTGWRLVRVTDLRATGAEPGTCERCGRRDLRFLRTIAHPERGELQVGSECARRLCRGSAIVEQVGGLSEEESASLKRWIEETNARHMAECNHPACDWYCCRLARGWTEEQIREDVERYREQHWQQRRQARRRSAGCPEEAA